MKNVTSQAKGFTPSASALAQYREEIVDGTSEGKGLLNARDRYYWREINKALRLEASNCGVDSSKVGCSLKIVDPDTQSPLGKSFKAVVHFAKDGNAHQLICSEIKLGDLIARLNQNCLGQFPIKIADSHLGQIRSAVAREKAEQSAAASR